MITLVELDDADFDWMSGTSSPRIPGWKLPPGGVDALPVLAVVRRLARRLHEGGCKAAWMAVAGQEVVGLCSYKSIPVQGRAEIGYGIAESRRGRGYATAAVATLVQIARHEQSIRALVAEVSADNAASSRVVEKNGFSHIGFRNDPEDGRLTLWELVL